MTEPVEAWWARRQRSKGVAVPYPVGTYREEWRSFPVLVRQYHPEFNAGVTLSQVPPAADVFLTWQCDVGHLFVATPEEQRSRPGGPRRKSTWCTECARLAVPKRPRVRPPLPAPAVPAPALPIPAGTRPASARSKLCPASSALRRAVGEAWHSECAPRPASAAEALLRLKLATRLEFDTAHNAVRVGRPFFEHLEVWPDLVLADLRVAIEYDTTGREGLEHVGPREEVDRRKDRLLREAGWEVIRVRVGPLQPIGPWDVAASSITNALVARILDRLAEIRGDLIVRSYLRLAA